MVEVAARWKLYLVAASAALLLLALVSSNALPARAVLADSSGKIAFVQYSDPNHNFLDVVNPDGFGLKRVVTLGSSTSVLMPEDGIVWSRDGRRIGFDTADNRWDVVYTSGGGQATRSAGRPVLSGMSPDGTKLLSTCPGGICVENTDSSHRKRMISGELDFPAWSPDGKEIAFERDGIGDGTGTEIEIANSDGSHQRTLIKCARNASCSFSASDRTQAWLSTAVGDPRWSPDGTKIAFEWYVAAQGRGRGGVLPEIGVINADGSGLKMLTAVDPPVGNWYPAWSPDGKKIAFSREPCATDVLCYARRHSSYGDIFDLYVMNADGSDPRKIVHGGIFPAWQPLDGGPPPAPTPVSLCGSPLIRHGRPSDVVIFIDGIGSEENQGDSFYPVPVAHPRAGVPVVSSYCPLDASGHERGWPRGLNLELRRWSEFKVPGGASGGSSSTPALGSVCDQPGGFHTDSCLVARLADAGAVLLPYSYSGANMEPDGEFRFDAYTADTTDQPPDLSIKRLEAEITSIRELWPNTDIYIVAHSYGGTIASHWWDRYHAYEPDVRRVFTLDGTVNGNADATIPNAANGLPEISVAVGLPVAGLWLADWNDLWANNNAAERDARLLADDTDGSLVTVGTPDDPTPGLRIEAQVLVRDCSSGPFTLGERCDPVSPPSVISPCSAKTQIYGIGGDPSTGHDVVKVCPAIVRMIVSSLRTH